MLKIFTWKTISDRIIHTNDNELLDHKVKRREPIRNTNSN